LGGVESQEDIKMIFTVLLIVVLSALFFAAAFFILAVFPVWMLVECIKTSLLPNTLKALWTVIIIMAWPFGSLAYAAFASQKSFFARLANTLMAALIIFSLLFGAGIYYFRSTLLPAAVVQYQKSDFAGISKQDQTLAKEHLLILQNEMQDGSFFSVRSLEALELFELFQSITIRPNVSPSKLKDWIQLVQHREMISAKSPNAALNFLREKTIRNIFKSS